MELYPYVYRFVRKRIGDMPDWEDVVQEVFCSSLFSLRRGDFERRSSLKTWVHKVMIYKVLDHLRGRWGLKECLFFEGFDYPSNNVSAEEIYEEKDLQEKVKRGFIKLSPRTRQVFYLLLYGWTQFEIAEVLGINHRTVYNHVKWGRLKVARFYKELEEI